MSHTPPPADPTRPEEPGTHRAEPRRRTGPSPVWFVVAGIVAAIVIYFLFFTTTPNPGVNDATVPGVTQDIEPSATGEAAPAAGGPAPIN